MLLAIFAARSLCAFPQDLIAQPVKVKVSIRNVPPCRAPRPLPLLEKKPTANGIKIVLLFASLPLPRISPGGRTHM